MWYSNYRAFTYSPSALLQHWIWGKEEEGNQCHSFVHDFRNYGDRNARITGFPSLQDKPVPTKVKLSWMLIGFSVKINKEIYPCPRYVFKVNNSDARSASIGVVWVSSSWDLKRYLSIGQLLNMYVQSRLNGKINWKHIPKIALIDIILFHAKIHIFPTFSITLEQMPQNAGNHQKKEKH